MDDSNTILDFYENQYDEGARLSRHSLEFIRTKEIIARYLNGGKFKIADICGATGPYSYWLALQGHEVHLLDLSAKHLEQARKNKDIYNVELASITCADARQLPFPDNAFDRVLLMGALYHLQDQQERLACVREAYRVLAPNGVAVFSFISRYASLVDGMRYALINDPEFVTILDDDLSSGKHNNPNKKANYFTTAFFHTPELIEQELRHGSFHDVNLFAVEGFASAIDTTVDMDVVLEYLRKTERVPELMGISSHILAVCKK